MALDRRPQKPPCNVLQKMIHEICRVRKGHPMYEPSLFAFADQLKAISKSGDPLELVARNVDFEAFRPTPGPRSTAAIVRKAGVRPAIPSPCRDPDPGRHEQPERRPDPIHDSRSARPAALPQLQTRRDDTGPEHDLAALREAGEGGRFREALPGLRRAAPREGLRGQERADRGRDGRLGSAPEDDGRGEGQG